MFQTPVFKDRHDIVAIALIKNFRIALVPHGKGFDLPHHVIRNFDPTELIKQMNQILKNISADPEMKEREYDDFQSIMFSCKASSIKNDLLSLFQCHDNDFTPSENVVFKSPKEIFEDLQTSNDSYGVLLKHYIATLVYCGVE